MGFPQELQFTTQAESYHDSRYHGAREAILFNGRDINATFRIYSDGIWVGCTFIDMKAVEFIVGRLKGEGVA